MARSPLRFSSSARTALALAREPRPTSPVFAPGQALAPVAAEQGVVPALAEAAARFGEGFAAREAEREEIERERAAALRRLAQDTAAAEIDLAFRERLGAIAAEESETGDIDAFDSRTAAVTREVLQHLPVEPDDPEAPFLLRQAEAQLGVRALAARAEVVKTIRTRQVEEGEALLIREQNSLMTDARSAARSLGEGVADGSEDIALLHDQLSAHRERVAAALRARPKLSPAAAEEQLQEIDAELATEAIRGGFEAEWRRGGGFGAAKFVTDLVAQGGFLGLDSDALGAIAADLRGEIDRRVKDAERLEGVLDEERSARQTEAALGFYTALADPTTDREALRREIRASFQAREIGREDFDRLMTRSEEDPARDDPATLLELAQLEVGGVLNPETANDILVERVREGRLTADTAARELRRIAGTDPDDPLTAAPYKAADRQIRGQIITTGPLSDLVRPDEEQRLALARRELADRVQALGIGPDDGRFEPAVRRIADDIVARYGSQPLTASARPRPVGWPGEWPPATPEAGLETLAAARSRLRRLAAAGALDDAELLREVENLREIEALLMQERARTVTGGGQ